MYMLDPLIILIARISYFMKAAGDTFPGGGGIALPERMLESQLSSGSDCNLIVAITVKKPLRLLKFVFWYTVSVPAFGLNALAFMPWPLYFFLVLLLRNTM